MKHTKKTATKGKSRKSGMREAKDSYNDLDTQIDRIATEHGDLGNDALNFFFTQANFPPFLRDLTETAINRAADAMNLPKPSDANGDSLEEFKRLVAVFEAAGNSFTLTDEKGGALRCLNEKAMS